MDYLLRYDLHIFLKIVNFMYLKFIIDIALSSYNHYIIFEFFYLFQRNQNFQLFFFNLF